MFLMLNGSRLRLLIGSKYVLPGKTVKGVGYVRPHLQSLKFDVYNCSGVLMISTSIYCYICLSTNKILHIRFFSKIFLKNATRKRQNLHLQY